MARRRRRRNTTGSDLAVMAVQNPKGCLWLLWGLIAAFATLTTLIMVVATITSPGSGDVGAVILMLIVDGVITTPLWLRFRKRRQLVEQGRQRQLLLMQSGIDQIYDPYQFESKVAMTLAALGYAIEQRQGGRGDRGADVIAIFGSERLVVQCKLYTGTVGHDAVNEAHAARSYFRCNRAAVATNSYFRRHAVEQARGCGVELWDRDYMASLFNRANALTAPPPPAPPPAKLQPGW